MPTIQVKLGKRSYPIWIKPGLLKDLCNRLAHMNKGQQWIIITQPYIAKEYGEQLVGSLRTQGFRLSLLTIPDGEQSKNLGQIESLYGRLIELKCDRSSTLLALGGGVVGDVTGFVAATFMRGVAYIQIPTTLLAMVDSAIGGKTGVNLPQGKNLVGVIYQPRAVAIDPLLLMSLSPRELISGLAEALKYGAIWDRSWFQELSQNIEAFMALKEKELLESAIAQSCKIKAEIVTRDEREGDLRRILNFGHTIGHALETITGYDTLRHGEAVALGMLCAGAISYSRGLLTDDEWTLFRETIRQLPLPKLPILDSRKILAAIKHDKKVRAGELHFVLLRGLGQAVIVNDVTDDEILKSLEIL